MLERLRRLIAPSSEQRLSVEHDGLTYPIVLKRDERARRYTLRVKMTSREAVLTMPLRGSVAIAQDFANRHGGWLAQRFARLPEMLPLMDGALLPLRGVPHRIEHRPAARGTVWTETEDGDRRIIVAGDPQFLKRRLRDFLKREALADLQTAVSRHANALGVTVKRVTVKDTRSRWGSCAADGSLSFSWRLILAPPDVLDYLAAHEVAHRVEMNHSPRYWRVVSSLYPGYEDAERWLKRHGSELHRWC